MNTIDVCPVGAMKSNAAITTKEQTQPTNMLLTDSLSCRLISKSWQVRSLAFEELLNAITEEKTEQLKLSKLWATFLNDGSPICLERVFNALNKFITLGKLNKENAKEVLECIICKGISSSKANIKAISIECLMNLLAITNEYDMLIDCSNCILNRTPSLVIYAAISANTVIEKIGMALFTQRRLFEFFIKLSASPNPANRKEAMIFYKRAYKNLGESILPMISELKQSQKEEILKSVEPKLNPVISSELDIYEIHSIVDCLPKITQDWCLKYNALSSWKQKKDSLEEILKLVSVPKIKPPLPSYIVNHFENILKDETNINVLQLCLKIITALGNGLRHQFGYWKRITIVMISMYKNKKLEEDISTCLSSLKWSIKLEELLDVLSEYLDADKLKQANPHMKRCIITWIGVHLGSKDITAPNSTISYIYQILNIHINDCVQEVRDAAFKAIAIIKQKSGNIENLVESPRNKNKVEIIKTPRKNMTVAKKIPVLSPKVEDEIPLIEAEKKLAEVVDPKIMQNLNSPIIKDKRAAIGSLIELINSQYTSCHALLQQMHEYYIRYCKKILKDWREISPQIISHCLSFLGTLISYVEVDKKAVNFLFNFIMEKCIDEKYRVPAETIMLSMTDCTGPEYMISKLICFSKMVNQVMCIKEVNMLVLRMINEYPFKLIPLKALLEFTKKQLTQPTKQHALDIIRKLYRNAGEQVVSYFSDLNENLIRLIYDECMKDEPLKFMQPLRILRGNAFKLMEDNTDVEAEHSERVDFSIFVTQQLIRNIESDKWNVRNEALLHLQLMLSNSNFRIMPNGLNELFKAVGFRIKDPHKGVQKGFIALISILAESIGPKIKQYHKCILYNLIDVMADKQQSIRSEASMAISKLGEIAGADFIGNAMSSYIQKDNHELRIEALQWLTKDCTNLDKCDHQLFLTGIMHCLLDKSLEIRKLAEKLLCKILSFVTQESIYKCIRDEKPTVQLQLEQTINKYFSPQQELPADEIIYEDEKAECSALKPQITPIMRTHDTIGTSPQTKANSSEDSDKSPTLKPKFNQARIKSVKKGKILLYQRNVSMRNSCVEADILSKVRKVSKSALQSSLIGKLTPSHQSGILKASCKSNYSLIKSEGRLSRDSDMGKFKPVILTPSKEKTKRAESDKKCPWISTETKGEAIEGLKRAIKATINPSLYNHMFSRTGSKGAIDCITAIILGLDEEYQQIISILDLILKWMGIKLQERNASINKSIFEFLSKLIELFITSSSMLTEYESRLLISILVEQIHSSSQIMKDTVMKLIISLTEVGQQQPIIKTLLKSIQIKDHKEKYDCLNAFSAVLSAYQSIDPISDKDFSYLCSLLKETEYKMATNSILYELFRLDKEACKYYFNKCNIIVDFEALSKYELMKTTKNSSALGSTTDTNTHSSLSKQHESTPGAYRSPTSMKAQTDNISNDPKIPVIKVEPPIQTITHSNIMPIISSIISMINNKDTFVSIMLRELITHPDLSNMKKPNDFKDLIYHLAKYSVEGTSSISAQIEEFCCYCDSLTIITTILNTIPEFPLVVTTFNKGLSIMMKKVTPSNVDYIFELIDSSVRAVQATDIIGSYKEFTMSLIECQGILVWQCVKQHTSLILCKWVDDTIYTKHAEFTNIIATMKSKGTKGIANSLREYIFHHNQLDFDKILARCSLILTQQIKDEVNEDRMRESSIPFKPICNEINITNTSSPIHSSLDILNSNTQERDEEDTNTKSLDRTNSIDERFKELSKEIMKIKNTGGL